MEQQTTQLQDTTSQNLSCRIIPYAEHDGMRTYTDTFIRSLYERMEKEGIAQIVFSDGEIKDADEFLYLMKHGPNALYLVDVPDGPAGILWLNRFKGKTCYVHFCAFQKYWGAGSVEIGREAICQVLYMKNRDGEYCLDTLLGLIPCDNMPAIKWLKKVGLKEVGVIPNGLWKQDSGKSEDGLLLYLTREDLKGN